ncbi:MAG: monovalent cation/H+ antiporter subunit D family protein [Magnetococcales bacterium]|nr:monovalent cation/H+ antiporter subunit D family protein [Magnetococcales bacterium]
MTAHLPVLQVVLPLMAAPLCVVIRQLTLVRLFSLVVTGTAFLISATLLYQVNTAGPISYAIGNWPAPYGIEYRIDLLNAVLLFIISLIGFLVLIYSKNSIAREITQNRLYLFHSLYLLCMTGLLGMVITGDVFNLFVFLEITALSSYALIAMGGGRLGNPQALYAAFRYLILGTLGGTFYIIGVGLMYMMTGALNMADLARLLPSVFDTTTIQAALGFLVVGITLKMALFPLHMWQAAAYARAPSTVSSFLAATATKVAVYVQLRMIFTVFGQIPLFRDTPLDEILIVLALSSMIIGSLSAVYQKDMRRMLAFSSLAQIGYIVLGIGLNNATALSASIVHLFNHALMKSALFMALGAVFMSTHSVKRGAMRGLGRNMPITMAAFVVAGLSLIGVPLTSGFISKWLLVQGALESGMWPVALMILVSSLLSIIYIWKVVEAAYFKKPKRALPKARDPGPTMWVPMWILAAASIWFGVDAGTTVGIANKVAETLLGGVPQ